MKKRDSRKVVSGSGYLGDENSTQLCGNYNKHYKDPYETTMYIMENKRFFFVFVNQFFFDAHSIIINPSTLSQHDFWKHDTINHDYIYSHDFTSSHESWKWNITLKQSEFFISIMRKKSWVIISRVVISVGSRMIIEGMDDAIHACIAAKIVPLYRPETDVFNHPNI